MEKIFGSDCVVLMANAASKWTMHIEAKELELEEMRSAVHLLANENKANVRVILEKEGEVAQRVGDMQQELNNIKEGLEFWKTKANDSFEKLKIETKAREMFENASFNYQHRAQSLEDGIRRMAKNEVLDLLN